MAAEFKAGPSLAWNLAWLTALKDARMKAVAERDRPRPRQAPKRRELENDAAGGETIDCGDPEDTMPATYADSTHRRARHNTSLVLRNVGGTR